MSRYVYILYQSKPLSLNDIRLGGKAYYSIVGPELAAKMLAVYDEAQRPIEELEKKRNRIQKRIHLARPRPYDHIREQERIGKKGL